MQYLKNNPHKKENLIKLIIKFETEPEKAKKFIIKTLEESIKEIPVNDEIKRDAQEKKEIEEEKNLKKEEKEKQIEEDEKQIEKNKKFQALLETKEAQKKLNIQITPEQQQQAQQGLKESGVLAQLQADTDLSEEQVNDYILFVATQNILISGEIQTKKEDSDAFFLSFKKLNNALNIQTDNAKKLHKDIQKTSTELFHSETGNKSLIKQLEKNKTEKHSGDYQELFGNEQDIKSLSEKYGRFVPNAKPQYEEISQKLERGKEISDEEQQFLQEYQTRLEQIKNTIINRTQDTLEQANIM